MKLKPHIRPPISNTKSKKKFLCEQNISNPNFTVKLTPNPKYPISDYIKN